MALMNIAGVRGAANAGHFRPLEVLTRPGSVFDPAPEAACSVYYEVRIRLYDLLLRCLAPHLGERLPAGHFASICGTFIGGRHPDTGRHFTIVEPQVGGWGGSANADGNSAQFSAVHGETFNCPAEVAEARYGLVVEAARAQPCPRGRGPPAGRQGDRGRLPRALGRLLPHLLLQPQPAPSLAGRGRESKDRATSPRWCVPTARWSGSRW